MKVLVCGGRGYDDQQTVFAALDEYAAGATLIIAGGAPGADTLAVRWAGSRNIPSTVFPARWNEYGKAAGMIRNRQMLVEGKPDLVIAFPGGNGTLNMIKLATFAGVKVKVMK